ADRVDSNAAIFQIRRPGPGERTHGGLRGAINTVRRKPFTADNGRIENDGGAIGHQRKSLLYCEKHSFDIGVEDRVVELLGDLAEAGILRDTGIREHDIELALLPFDLRE